MCEFDERFHTKATAEVQFVMTGCALIHRQQTVYCRFSRHVTKIQTTKLLILLRFYFHDV